jgi:hypothetical protein
MNANEPLVTPLENLNSRVKTVWQRSQKLHVTAGLLSFCRWGIMLFVVGVLLDWLVDLPAPARIALCAVILGVALYQAWCSGWRNVRRFNAARAAMQIEDHHGDFESLLVTAVQFRESKMAPGTSESLQEVTCLRAEEAVATVQPEKVIHYQGLRRPLTIALALALIIAAFGVFNGPFLGAGIARIFPPWTSIAYPTRTQLEVAPDKIIVKEGSPAVIKAIVSGVIPSDAELELRTGKGEPRIHELEITDGQCEYTVKAAYRGFEYRILAGDAKSPWQEVEVISAPRIKKAKLNLEYPPYTKRPTETVTALTVTVPEGTNIEWKLSLDRAVSEASYTPAGGETKPLDISKDGFTVTMSAPATESRAYSFSWVEKTHGFSFNSSNHYLQVAPDQAPRVELTSPKNHLFATLGRKVDLAFRARDDHGIGESQIAFRVNKIEEQKVKLPLQDVSDGGEQKIDWDYRKALPDLAIGDTVSFVVELTDLYPGAEGPHRVRSQARRISILSERDYLRQIYKQKQRLLRKLRTLYREERKVHATVSQLDPSSGEFIQSCQLEAVRQDLMRERIGALKQGIKDLMDDLAANNIKRESVTALLVRLHADLQTIADEHIGQAATNLRELAVTAQKNAKSKSSPPSATATINSVDSAARELGCLVLQIGFREATEVMARELHAIAESQAPMRLKTILLNQSSGSEAETLAKSQEQLGQWVTRLFGALPQDKESTMEDALVAFNLSRLVKGLRRAGVETKMQDAAALIRKPIAAGAAGSSEAAVLQAEIIESLLYAEFRLRLGSEHEALEKAGDLFSFQVTEQKKLHEAMAALSPEQFKQRRSEFTQSQAALQQKLHLLLMPAIPAPRSKLFDANLPPKPPVEDLLATAESAMKKAAAHITAGERDQAVAAQQESEKSFIALSEIISQRIGVLTERIQFFGLGMGISSQATQITEFEERQLNLIEKTEDAENDSQTVHIGRLQEKLAQDIGKFRLRTEKWNKEQLKPSDDVLPLLNYLEQLESSMNKAATALKGKNIDDSIEHQEATLTILEDATKLLVGQSTQNGSLSTSVNDTSAAIRPAPYVSEIEAEQRDLLVIAAKAKPADLPQLAIVQKNLIHAVNAVLSSLDPLSHQIESGTVFLFAKDDMDAAATAIEDNDMEEAVDAGSFVAESLQNLSKELAIVTPRYSYMLELNEFYHQAVSENNLVRMQQSQLRTKAIAAVGAAGLQALVDTQTSLQTEAKSYANLMFRGTGQKSYGASAEAMTAVLNELKAGNKEAAVKQMQLVETTLTAKSEQMLYLMELIAEVLKPSPYPEVPPESLLVLDILSLASDQKVLYRKTQAAKAKPGKDITAEQLKLAKRCELLIKRTQEFAPTFIAAQLSKLEGDDAVSARRNQLQALFSTSQAHIVQANKLIADAAGKLQSGAAKDAISIQHQANELLRYFLVSYIDGLLVVMPPAGPEDPIVTEATDPSMTDSMLMYMPGAVSGTKPKGGRQEWEVLGQRDRAALNENFARELPLEYRAVLKDYYERLAK